MKKHEVQINHVYNVLVSGKIQPVRIDRDADQGGWWGTNLLTARKIRIRSAQRLRSEKDRRMYMSPEDANFLSKHNMT